MKHSARVPRRKTKHSTWEKILQLINLWTRNWWEKDGRWQARAESERHMTLCENTQLHGCQEGLRNLLLWHRAANFELDPSLHPPRVLTTLFPSTFQGMCFSPTGISKSVTTVSSLTVTAPKTNILHLASRIYKHLGVIALWIKCCFFVSISQGMYRSQRHIQIVSTEYPNWTNTQNLSLHIKPKSYWIVHLDGPILISRHFFN